MQNLRKLHSHLQSEVLSLDTVLDSCFEIQPPATLSHQVFESWSLKDWSLIYTNNTKESYQSCFINWDIINITIKFTVLKNTVQWFSVYSQSYGPINTNFLYPLAATLPSCYSLGTTNLPSTFIDLLILEMSSYNMNPTICVWPFVFGVFQLT